MTNISFAIANTTLVFGFNLVWLFLCQGNLQDYIEIYNFKWKKWISLYAWLYLIWGVANLIYVIKFGLY